MDWRQILPAAVAACGMIGLSGCGASSTPTVVETAPPAVVVAEPVQRQVVDYDEYTGSTDAVQTVEVRPRVSGYITNIAFEDGQEVEADDVLFEIDPRPYEASVAKAKAEVQKLQAELQLAEIDLKRNERLVKSRAAAREDLDVSTAKKLALDAQILAAKAEVEQAELDLKFTKVRAPVEGLTSRRYVTLGNLVTADQSLSQPLTTIVSIDPMYVYFDVDEPSMLRYLEQARTRAGADKRVTAKDAEIPVTMALATDTEFPHKGVIDFADNRLDPSTGTIRVRAVFPNENRVLRPGLFTRVRVEVSDPYEAVLVSERAIGTDQDLKFVYVVNENNEVERRDVSLGRLQGDGLRVIENGLEGGERVIVNGIQRARPGIKVDPKPSEMPVLPGSDETNDSDAAETATSKGEDNASGKREPNQSENSGDDKNKQSDNAAAAEEKKSANSG